MRIPDVKGLISIANARLESSKKAQPGPAGSSAAQADKVELSQQAQAAAKLLEGGLESSRAQTQERLAAIELVKQELASGGLKVDSAAIARRMVDSGVFDDLTIST